VAAELVRRRLIVLGTALAAVAGVGLPAFRPLETNPAAASVGPVVALALFAVLAGRPRLPAMRRGLCVRLTYLAAGAALEELLWRGVLLAALAPWAGRAGALAATTAGFAASHVGLLGPRANVHFLTGASFGGAFLLAGLPAAVAAHAGYNVLVDLGVQAERAARP
jgi:membrane protease YdiL (CAAX protease family)